MGSTFLIGMRMNVRLCSLMMMVSAGAAAAIGTAHGCRTQDASVSGSDSRRDLSAILPAPTPHPSLGADARLFDRFVGTWDSEHLIYGADGTTTRLRGEAIFGWIIDGRALQDVWITYPDKGPSSDRSIGTSIRCFDPRSALWRVVWVHPSTGVLISLTGGAAGDRIVLHGTPGDGSELRWSFNDIRPDSFVWRGEVSRDGGKTWQLRNEQRMRRRVVRHD